MIVGVAKLDRDLHDGLYGLTIYVYDPDGNITMEREALTIESLSLAMAAHNSGGLVIAQTPEVPKDASVIAVLLLRPAGLFGRPVA